MLYLIKIKLKNLGLEKIKQNTRTMTSGTGPEITLRLHMATVSGENGRLLHVASMAPVHHNTKMYQLLWYCPI